MEQTLQFIGQNKYVLIIGFIAFIIQFKGLAYLIKNKRSDYSYSGHSYEWYDGDTKKNNFSYLSFYFWYSYI